MILNHYHPFLFLEAMKTHPNVSRRANTGKFPLLASNNSSHCFPDGILQLNHNRITLGNHDSNGAGKHTEVHTEGSVIFDDRDASACDPRSSVHARSLLKDHWVTPIEQRGFPLAIRIISIPIKAKFISNKFLTYSNNVPNLIETIN